MECGSNHPKTKYINVSNSSKAQLSTNFDTRSYTVHRIHTQRKIMQNFNDQWFLEFIAEFCQFLINVCALCEACGIDNGKHHEHRGKKGFVTVLRKGNVNFFSVEMCLIDNERLRPSNNNSHSAQCVLIGVRACARKT